MSARPALGPADPSRPVPECSGARHDDIRRALATLLEERRRLERLGLEWPLARCREQIRYWSFLEALHSLERAPQRGFEPSGGR